MRTTISNLSWITASLILSACGGGGGGGGAGIVPTTFTSWIGVAPDSTVIARGVSVEGTYQYDLMSGAVIGVGTQTVSSNSSATMTFDENSEPSKMVLTTPASTTNLELFAPLFDGAVAATNSAFTTAAIIAEPGYWGCEYQTFGIWESEEGGDTLRIGAISFGAPTPGATLTSLNTTAAFAGNLIGDYVSAAGQEFVAVGEVNVNVDFAARTLGFSSVNTELTTDMVSFTPNSGLDLSGTLTYAAGTNSFAGTVTSASTTLSGESIGLFYGPTAEELGGIFVLEGAGLETFGGAYGAARQP